MKEKKIFYSEIVKGCRFFRIPYLAATKKGTVIAGIDLNFGSTGDSADNIDVCMRRRLSGKDEFSDVQVPDCLHLTDYADEFGYRQESASYIDGAIITGAVGEDGNERIYLMCDAWAWSGGILGRGLAPIAENGLAAPYLEWRAGSDKLKESGFCHVDGKDYLLLSDKNIVKTDEVLPCNEVNCNDDLSLFNFAADVSEKSKETGRYLVYRLSGMPDSPVLGEITEFELDENYCLYQNGIQLFCAQMTQDKDGNHLSTGKTVSMNILYKRSLLQVYNTVYLYLFCSDDDGQTWRLIANLNATAKPPEVTYFLCGVGRGTILKKGKYKGRMLFPCYGGTTKDQFSYAIYSDDGIHWKYSARVSNITSSEGALLEMPDGSLRFIMRTSLEANGKYLISESYDGGCTWEADHVRYAGFGNPEDEGVGCQISGINYSRKITLPENSEEEYEAVFVSCPDKRAREHGLIYTGILKQDDDGKYDIHWIARKTVTEEKFAYSCLTELPDGRIALLYEKALRADDAPWEEGLKQIYYSEFDLQELLEDRLN